MNKNYVIIGGIVLYLLWRNQAAVAATTIGSAGNPAPVLAPTGTAILSPGNSGIISLPILTAPIYTTLATNQLG